MFGALKRGCFRSLASLILVVNVVGELQQKRTLAASRGFLAAARLSCFFKSINIEAFINKKGSASIGDFVPQTLCSPFAHSKYITVHDYSSLLVSEI